MTGIHLPPGLAPGQAPDPQSLRPALAIDRLAALQPVPETTESSVQNSTGQAIRHSQQAAGPNGMPAQAALLPGTSTRESLSSAARAILAVMEGAGPQPVKAGMPLLPAPPAAGLMQAAAAALANAVGQSGLFYESHLAQWVGGARPLSTILQEPQAGVPRTSPQAAPGQPSATQPQASTSAMLTYAGPASGDVPRISTPPLLPASQVLAEALASPRNPRVAHSHAPSEQGVRQGTGSAAVYSRDADTPPPRPSTGMLATQAYQATADAARPAAAEPMAAHAARTGNTDSIASEASRQAAPAGPAIHPATEGVVRQQLELLATQQFRFAGEAWPGAAMEWDIRRTDPEANGQGPDDASRPWSSRIRLQLPSLGTVEVLLTLGPSGLEARVATGETDIAARLIAARPLLRNRLEAQGIPLQRLNIQTQDDLAAGATS